MGRGEQAVEGLEVAEQRVDVGVVGDVVAEVGHRGAVERRQPDRRDTQRAHVVEVRRDAVEVADAVTVASPNERV